MPNYSYKAKKGPTEIVEGEVLAESEEIALSILQERGLIPIRLELATEAVVKRHEEATKNRAYNKSDLHKKTPPISIDPKKVRVSPRDLNIFTRQFSILLKASVPLLRVFEVLQAQTQNQKFRVILQGIQEDLREGISLSDSLTKYPRVFSNIYINMINSGEVSGTLDQILMRLAEFAERESEVRSKVKSAMVYPFFLLMVGVGTVFVLLTFVMPRLMVVFGDLGTDLPGVTKFVIALSEFCQANWIWMIGGAVAAGGWFQTKGLSEKQSKALDYFILGVPIFGELVKKNEISRFLRSLELLYENGIPLYQAVEVGTQTIANRAMKVEFVKVPSLLEGGATLAQSLSEVKPITEFVTNMVSVGEESGQLGSALGETAAFYEQETNQFVKIATSLLEPIMILGIGLVIGFLVIAMLLPMFEIHVLAS